MYKSWIWNSMILLLLSTALCAQSGELQKGIQAFEKQDFPKALQYFQIVLNTEAQLKGNTAAEAYLYRAKTQMALLQQAVQSGQEEAIERQQHALILAAQDLEAATEKNQDKKFAKTIDAEQERLYLGLLQGGAGFLQRLYQDADLNAASRAALLDAAQRYLAAAKKLRPSSYRAYDLYGQVMMLKRDNESAEQHYLLAIEKYNSQPSASPDLQHYNVYANLALLEMQGRQTKQALAYLDEGKRRLQAAYQQSQDSSSYQLVYNGLEKLELDIYLNSPELLDPALLKFKTALEQNPKDYLLQMAYAGLLEKKGNAQEALSHYQKASELKADFLPHYNIGIIHLKSAQAQQKAIEGEATEAEIASLKAQYEQALQAFEKAHELAPKDLPTLEALVLISSRLEMKEAYLAYRNKKKALQ